LARQRNEGGARCEQAANGVGARGRRVVFAQLLLAHLHKHV
jgi:hypothetical protein